METTSCCWECLPGDILQSVTERLNYGDCIHLAAVCKHWRAVVKNTDIRATPRLPWLLYHDTIARGCQIRFYDFSEDRFYYFNLHETWKGGQIRGSCKGWVLVALPREYSCYLVDKFLVDPISRICSRLPMMERTFGRFSRHEHDIRKIELSSADPSDSGCMVAAIFDRWTSEIGICRLKDDGWSFFDIDFEYYALDILFSSTGILYVLIISKLGSKPASPRQPATHNLQVGDDDVVVKFVPTSCGSASLIESDGKLLISNKFSQGIEVFKVVVSGNSTIDVTTRLNDLDNQVLLRTDQRSSLSVPVTVFQGSATYKNCILCDDRTDDVSELKLYVCEDPKSNDFFRQRKKNELSGQEKKENEKLIMSSTFARRSWFSPKIRLGLGT